jgi:hypothetical protein
MSADKYSEPAACLKGRHFAMEVADHMIIAHYASQDPAGREWHMKEVHRNFEKLAKALGYHVERIDIK